MLIRYGVRLSPRLADLLDMIEHSGDRGVQLEVLCGVFYPGRSSKAAGDCVKSNIWHLNSRLAETDVEVRAGKYEPYRLIKRRAP